MASARRLTPRHSLAALLVAAASALSPGAPPQPAGGGAGVTADGTATSAGDGWLRGPPFWRAGGYWKNRSGAVTFPLHRGGWFNGRGRRYVPLNGVTFAHGPSLPLHFYQSIAVDPSV